MNAHAQQPAGPQAEPKPPDAARAPAKVIVGGCIQNVPVAPATGGAAASAPGAKFVLANAKQVVGGADSGAVAPRYRLEGEEKTISTHLNHQVEITGIVQTISASTPGATGPAAGPMLKVESVKMIADKCS